MLGRFLNYLLVPIYTNIFSPNEYGVVTELYAYVGFLMVLLLYGMETAFFRFATKHKNPQLVHSTALWGILGTTVMSLTCFIFFADVIALKMGYAQNSEYLYWFAAIIGFDVISSIPFARLRLQNKATKFATIKFIEIGVNIGCNLFFLMLAPRIAFLSNIIPPEVGIGYIFISNLIASGVKMMLLSPQLKTISTGFSLSLWKKMLSYAWPLLFVGMAGMVNEMLDRALLKTLLPYDVETNLVHLGIYGACYKLSILMILFVQAFRYAAEPFFFNKEQDKNSKVIYGHVLKYFTIAGCVVFLVVCLFIDLFKYFIGPDYWSGLGVVPILLFANLLLGMLVNVNMWYKLSGKTRWGILVGLAGAVITIVLNVVWIPHFGYVGSAWATLICYAVMLSLSYWLGQNFYKIKYPVKRIAMYVVQALFCYGMDAYLTGLIQSPSYKYMAKAATVLSFVILVYFKDIKRLSPKAI